MVVCWLHLVVCRLHLVVCRLHLVVCRLHLVVCRLHLVVCRLHMLFVGCICLFPIWKMDKILLTTSIACPCHRAPYLRFLVNNFSQYI